MRLNILLFGITKDIIGSQNLELDVTSDSYTVAELLDNLSNQYPALQKLSSLLVAVNEEYAQPTTTIQANDEVALIPPVSGG